MRRHGRASVKASSPSAFAICDRCGFLYNRRDLGRQHEYRGVGLQNTRKLVCDSCRDTPNQQLRAIRLKTDPRVTANPRPQAPAGDIMFSPGVGAATWAGSAPFLHIVFPLDLLWTPSQSVAWGGGSFGTSYDMTWGPQS